MNAIPPAMRPVRVVDAGRRRLTVGSRLTVAEAPALSHAVSDLLSRRARSLVLDLRSVVAVDAVGLAALLACQRASDVVDVECSVAVSAGLERELIDAKLIEQFPIVPPRVCDQDETPAMPATGAGPSGSVVAETARLALRQASVGDIELFRQWAYDPLVDQMVGSDLLYKCRHLAPEDPTLLASIVHDPRALTVLVDVQPDGAQPVGFVRLYDIDLVSGFGFLETVVAERRSARRGLGIEASRLLIAYCQDVMGIRRVEAKAYAYNLLSINGLKRNGFQQEGVLREAHIYDNQAWDIFVFSILDAEITRERERDEGKTFHLFPHLTARA
jgi:RimJ/RimL family protein N-acetyltransferase/anti-anti-sigma regulatory factor